MSEGPIVGGVGVRIRAVADEQQIKAEAQKVKTLAGQQPIDITVEAKVASAVRLDQLKKDLKEVQALQETFNTAFRATGTTQPEVFQRFLDVRPELQGLEARAAEIRNNIVLEQELQKSIQQRRSEDARAARAPVTPAAADERRPGGIREFIRAGAAGREGGLAGLLGAGARLGAVGFAATAAFQAVNELQSALRVTGDEAFTATGKARNFAAELTSANFIGAIRAITAVRPAEFIGPLAGDITAQIEKVKTANDDLAITEEKLIQIRSRGQLALEQYVAKLALAGHISGDEAKAILVVGDTLDKQRQNAIDAALALDQYDRALQRVGGHAGALFGPEGLGGLRGPGGIPTPPPNVPAGTVIGQQRTGIPQPIVAPDRSVFTPGAFAGSLAASQTVANQIRASITARIKDDEERLRQTVRDKQVVAQQAQAAFDVAKQAAQANHNVNAAADEYQALVVANSDVVSATQAAAASAKAAADETQNLANSVAQARVAAIADPKAQQQAALALARQREAQAKTDFENATKGTKEFREAQAAYQIAQAETAGIENSIAYQATQAAKAAAEQRAASNKAGREQALENAITVAVLSKQSADNKVAFDAAIRYWVGLRNAASNVEEREAARAKVIDLYQRRAASLKQEAVAETDLLRITNDILAARLTPGLADDRKRAKILVDYWRDKMKTATDDAEREKARTGFLQARLALQGLKQTGPSIDVANEKLFAFAADQQRRFASNFQASATGLLAPQDARGRLGALITGPRGPEATAQRTRESQLSETRKQTGLLQVIAHGPKTKIVGKKVAPEVGREVARIGYEILRGL